MEKIYKYRKKQQANHIIGFDIWKEDLKNYYITYLVVAIKIQNLHSY